MSYTCETMTTTQTNESRARRLSVARPRRKRAAFRAVGLLVAAALLLLALVILLRPGAREAAEKQGASPGLDEIQKAPSDATPQRP
jgi:hypothetical protein